MPTAAVTVFAVARLVTGMAAGAVVTRKVFAVGAVAYKATLVETERAPVSVAGERTQIEAQVLTADNWNVSAAVAHANTADWASSAAEVMVPQEPVMARLLAAFVK